MSSMTIERPQANAKKKNKKQQKQQQHAVNEDAKPAVSESESIPTVASESSSDLSSNPLSSNTVSQQQQPAEDKNSDASVKEEQSAMSETQQPSINQPVEISNVEASASSIQPQQQEVSVVQEEVIPSAYPSLVAEPSSSPVVASPISHSPIYPQSLEAQSFEPGGSPIEAVESSSENTFVPGQEITAATTTEQQLQQDTMVPGMEEEKKDDVENLSQSIVQEQPSIPSNADLQPAHAEITPSHLVSPMEQIQQVEQPVQQFQQQQQHQLHQPLHQQPLTLQPQLSVPTMLQEQLAQRISAHEKVDLLSVQGPLQSDAASLALLHEKLTNMHSYNHWFERKAGALRGRFFELVEGFRTSQFSVCQVKMNSVELKHSIQYNQAMLWKLRQVRMEQKQVCGDGIQLEHFITHAVAEFDVAGAERMFHQLTELQRKAIQELTSHRFLAQSNALQVELYLSELLASKGLNPFNSLAPSASVSSAPQRRHSEGISVPGGIHVQHEGGETPQSSPFSPLPSHPASNTSSTSTLDFLQQLRYCIDVLFYFEKLQDPAHEQEKSLWKIKARERRDRQSLLESQKATNAAVLAAQPNQPISPEPPQPPVSASQIAASALPPAVGGAHHDNHGDLLELEVDADIDGELFTADAAFASPVAGPSGAAASSISQLLNDHTKFRQSVRKWLKLLIDALYTAGSYSDHLYILSQVLRCRGSTKWASFVQFARINARDANFAAQQRLHDPHHDQVGVPGGMREIEGQMGGENGGLEWAWTDEFIQHLFASVALALTPLDAKNLKFQIQSSSIATSSSASSSSSSSSGVSAKAFEQVLGGGGLSQLGEWSKESSAEEGESVRIAEEKQAASASPAGSDNKPLVLAGASPTDSGAEWIVLDETKLKNALNPDVSYRVSLNESDYCTLIQHIPILPFIKSRFYPLFLSVAKRHVSTHLNERMTTGGAATSSTTTANVPADNAYDSFDRHQLTEAFTQTKVLLQFFTTALTRFPEYPQLSKLIAKQMCLIVGLIGESWKRAWKVARNEEELMQHENLFPGAAPSSAASASSSSSAEDAGSAQPQFLPCGLYPYPCCRISHEFYGLLQKELDFCLLRLTCSIQHCQISGIKFFLSDLPYHLLSSEAAGQAFLILMNQSHLSDYSNSSLTFTPLLLSNWFAYLSSNAGIQTRDNFASLLLNPNGGYIHVLMALTKLCTKPAFEISPFIIPPINSSAASPPHNSHGQRRSSISKNHSEAPGGIEMKEAEDLAAASFDGSESNDKNLTDYKFRSSITDLPLIYLNELFHISYLNQSTREELFRPAQTFITSICSTHPLAISFLLFLCHTYFRYIAAGAIALFEQIDLSAWRPTASDMYILQALLMTPSNTPSNELARFVLLNLNYSSILTNEPSKFELHSRLQSQRGSIAEMEGGAVAAAAAAAHRNPNRSVDLLHAYFPPRLRVPLLGWQFHRALLLMLSEVRIVSIRNNTLTSSTSASSVGAPNSNSAPPPPPFNSFINFPTAAFAHFLTAQVPPSGNVQSGNTSNNNSRRNSLHHSHILQTAMMNNSLPQPPPVEQHLHQQFEAQQLQQRQALLANGQFSAAPPLPTSATMPAFSSLSNAPATTGANAPNSNPLASLLAPASSLFTEVFSSNTKKPIEPAWWLKMLSLLATRDTDGSVPFPVLRCWLSQRFSVLGVDLEDYTNLVMRDPVLSYIQLQVSWVGTESHRFANSGWQLVKGIMADATYANLGVRALHDLLPALLHGAVLSQANSPILKPAASSPSWQMISASESAGLQPPPLALGPTSSAPLSSASFSNSAGNALAGLPAPYVGNGSGTPPRVSSRRGSLGNQHLPHHQLHGSSTPPSNPFAEHSCGAPLHHSASHSPILQPSMMTPNRMVQHNPVDAYNTLANLQILKQLVEQSRPKSMFSFIQSKSVTYEGTQLVAAIISAQLIASMKASGGAQVNPELLMSPLHVIFNFWSGELSRAPMKPNEMWTRDHNFRFLFDTLCQTVFLWNDWLTEPREGAVINANMKLLYKFIGEQSVTHAMSTASHPSAISNMGIERRNGNYLSSNALLGAIRAAHAGAPQDDVEITYDWIPNAPPPKHVVDTLNPPETILAAFSLSAKDAVNRHPYATFVSLMEETVADRSAWLKFGYMLCRWDLKSVLKVTLKTLGIIDDKVRRQCMVRRWFVHALACPTDCPLLPLYWQMAFRLMFARMHLAQPLHSNMGGFFGYRFMTGTSGRVLMQQCREQLLALAEIFAKKRLEVINSNKNGSPLIHPSVYELPSLFTAMHAWLTAEPQVDPASHLNSLRERLLGFGVTLQEKFLPSHLASILLPTADRMTPLWMEMVDLAKLRWDQFQQLTSHTQTALLIPSPQLFTVHSPLSNEGIQYAFFHRYYTTQNYRLSMFAPSPQHVIAIMKRKRDNTSTTGNPFNSTASTASDIQAMFSASEFASPLISRQVGEAVAEMARALALSGAVVGMAAAKKANKNSGLSSSVWSASFTPIPLPVLASPASSVSPAIGAAASSSSIDNMLSFQIPSILLAPITDLFSHDSELLQPLRESIRLFTDRYSRCTALDRHMLDSLLPHLFRNEQADFHVSVPCRVGWGGASKCRMPVQFYFNFSRALKIRQIEENIDQNRQQAGLCLEMSASAAVMAEIGVAFCASLIAVQRIIRHLLQAADELQQPASQPHGMMMGEGSAMDRQHELIESGVRWLFSLASVDSSVSALFPPAHYFLHTSIASLAPLLNHPHVHSVKQQQQLLETLVGHVGLIPLLSNSIDPISITKNDPNAYLHLFRLALNVRDADGVTSTTVMQRFDVKKWLQTATAPLLLKQQFFSMVANQLREEEKQPRRRVQPNAPNAANGAAAAENLCMYYAQVLLDLTLTSDFTEMFDVALPSILEDVKAFGVQQAPNYPQIISVPPQVAQSNPAAICPTAPRASNWLHHLLQGLSRAPLHMLPWEQVLKSAQSIETALWQIRRSHTEHVKQVLSQQQRAPVISHSNLRVHLLLGNLLPTVCQFYRSLFTATHPSFYPSATLESKTSAVVCYASSIDKKNACWNAVWQCMSAFLAPDPPPLINNNSLPQNAPLNLYIDTQQQLMIDTFLFIISLLKSSGKSEENWVFLRFWNCYTNQITVNADVHFLYLLHQTIMKCTKIPQPIDMDQPASAVNKYPIPGVFYTSIPAQPVLDFHSSWFLTSSQLLSFTNTLKQVTEMHEKEVKSMIAVEKSRRETEHNQKIQLARGTKREGKLGSIVEVRRSDVKMMSQLAVKVESIAAFISHLLASSNWSYFLQQKSRFVPPALKVPENQISSGSEGMGPAVPEEADASQSATFVSPQGMYEPAVITSPYELFDASPATDYATTLLVTIVHVLSELPSTPFSAAASSSSAPATSPVLPHFQQMLNTLLHIDWIAVFLVRLPFEAFQMRHSKRQNATSAEPAGEEEALFSSPSVPVANEENIDDGLPKSTLPSAEEMHSLGLAALDREVGTTQTLLEQISMILYSDRIVAKVIDEISFMNLQSINSAVKDAANNVVRPNLLASLLSNPLGALSSSSTSTASSIAPVSSSSLVFEKKEDLSVCRSPIPGVSVGLLGDADLQGLIRAHYNTRTHQLLQRYSSDFKADELFVNTPLARITFVFHLTYRLCAPMPPIPYLQHPTSASNKFHFVPLVLLLRRTRLYAEWLLSVFNNGDGDAPRPLMLEQSYLDIAGALLSHLNDYHDVIQVLVGDEEFIPVLQEFMFVANLEARGVNVSRGVRALTDRIFSPQYEKLTLLAVTASCRSIISLDKLAQFLEQVLQVWKDSHSVDVNNNNMSRPNHWQTVSATLQVPEISFDEFIFACLNNGSILTLHVVSLQQLMMSAKMISNPYSAASAVSAGGGNSAGSSASSSSAAAAAAARHNMMEAVPATPSPASMLDPLKKHTMAQPRAIVLAAATASSPAMPLLTQPLDPKPIQQRVEQLFQWLLKAQIKTAEQRRGPKGSAAAALAAANPFVPVNGVEEEDIESMKLLVILRTLLEWQGSLVKGYFRARGVPVYEPTRPIRWSNPLLNHLMLYPDPCPILTFADTLIDQMQQLLVKWLHETKSTDGLLGMMGLNSSPKYSVKFRLLLKALHTYFMLHAQPTLAATVTNLASGQLKSHKAPPLHFCWDVNGGQATFLPAVNRFGILQQFTTYTSQKAFLPLANQARAAGGIVSQAAEITAYSPHNPATSVFVPLMYSVELLDQLVHCMWPEVGQ